MNSDVKNAFANVKTYRTDSSGTVIFMSDGADITVATEQ